MHQRLPNENASTRVEAHTEMGADPLLQPYRPPQQTPKQAGALQSLIAKAQSDHEAARPYMLSLMQSVVQPACAGLPCAGSTPAELLTMLDYEWTHDWIIHNAPADETDPAGIVDDTVLRTTLTNGYLQNVCQRYALGVENIRNYQGEYAIMREYMHIPAAKDVNDPTLRESNECILYLADNLWKRYAGNYIYGSITYVHNPSYADKFAVSPYDSGAHFKTRGAVFGTRKAYYHVIKEHLNLFGEKNVGLWFQRWYAPSTPLPKLGTFPYFELQWFGNSWLPDSLLTIVAKFDGDGGGEGIFGKTIGTQLRDVMASSRTPLLWSNGDSTGSIIDPSVCSIVGISCSQADTDAFNEAWEEKGTTFATLYSKISPQLQFNFLNYYNQKICTQVETDAQNVVLGVNAAGACVYYTRSQPATRWECLNDGTCGLSYSSRGTFFSEQDCLANCASKWGCFFNKQTGGMTRNSHTVEPAPGGECNSVETCEKCCTAAGDTCGQPGPGPGPGPKPPACQVGWLPNGMGISDKYDIPNTYGRVLNFQQCLDKCTSIPGCKAFEYTKSNIPFTYYCGPKSATTPAPDRTPVYIVRCK